MGPPMDSTNPRVDPPFQSETNRTLWIGWGANGVSLALQIIVGGLFFGYLFLFGSIAMVFRGWKPAWFANHIDAQIIAGTPYRRTESIKGWGVTAIACLILAAATSWAHRTIAPEKPDFTAIILDEVRKLRDQKQVVALPDPIPVPRPTPTPSSALPIRVKLIFKDSPLFTPARRQRITRQMDEFRNYLVGLGL